MTHPKLRKEESDVLKNLLSGMSTSAVARKLGLHRSKVKNIIDRLVYYGLIRAVPGTKNPVIYEDPYNVIPFPLRGEPRRKPTIHHRCPNPRHPPTIHPTATKWT